MLDCEGSVSLRYLTCVNANLAASTPLDMFKVTKG